MSTYRIGEQIIKHEDDNFHALLATVHGIKKRPFCLCRPIGIEMYISKVDGKYIVKRMPNTGGEHAATCDSYEAPPELSGLGEVMGSAIQENPDDEKTVLKFDFSLTKVAGRPAPVPTGEEVHSVKTDGNTLTLRATLHYLYDQAGFSRWSPSMQGKRSWYVVRKYLMEAAENKLAKGSGLADILYIPESFSVEKKDAIHQRRLAKMTRASTRIKGAKTLMLVIGEIKEIAPSRYGFKVVLKHLADTHFIMNEDLHKRLQKRFEIELGLWDAIDEAHLLTIGTFSVRDTGIVTMEEMALMVVDENWIPFESTYDKTLIEKMCRVGRRFSKGMRYNLSSTKPLACLVASDTLPEPTAMYILPPGATENFSAELTTLMEESKLQSWLWKAGESDMPALP
jgi:hypothetical protein